MGGKEAQLTEGGIAMVIEPFVGPNRIKPLIDMEREDGGNPAEEMTNTRQ